LFVVNTAGKSNCRLSDAQVAISGEKYIGISHFASYAYSFSLNITSRLPKFHTHGLNQIHDTSTPDTARTINRQSHRTQPAQTEQIFKTRSQGKTPQSRVASPYLLKLLGI